MIITIISVIARKTHLLCLDLNLTVVYRVVFFFVNTLK